MFKRWMIVVSVMIALSLVPYFKSEADNLRAQDKWVAIGDECTKHLERQPDIWTIENDSWYLENCDSGAEYSKSNIAFRSYRFYSEAQGTSMMIVAGCVGIAFVSLLGRWIYLGVIGHSRPLLIGKCQV